MLDIDLERARSRDLEIHWSDRARSWRHVRAVAERCLKDTGGLARRRLLDDELEARSSVLCRFQFIMKEASASETFRIFQAALDDSSHVGSRTSSI